MSRIRKAEHGEYSERQSRQRTFAATSREEQQERDLQDHHLRSLWARSDRQDRTQNERDEPTGAAALEEARQRKRRSQCREEIQRLALQDAREGDQERVRGSNESGTCGSNTSDAEIGEDPIQQQRYAAPENQVAPNDLCVSDAAE